MSYAGDFTAGATVALPFETQVNGALFAVSSLAVALFDLTAPTVAITAAITLTQSVNSVTGSHMAEIDTSNGAYGAGKDYVLRPTAGTVNGVSIIGMELGRFSLQNRSMAAVLTAVDALPTNAELATALAAADDAILSAIAGLNDLSADDLLDLADGVESGITLRETMRVLLAGIAGKVSGASTATIKFRDTNDTKDRITATTTTDQDRTAVTLDVS